MIPTLLWVSSPVSRDKEDMMGDRTASEQDGDHATSGHGQGLKKEPCFQRDSLLPSSRVSLISQLLSHTMISRGLDPHLLFPSSQAADLPQDYGDGVSPAEGVQALALPQPCAPAPLPCASDRDQISNEHLRAKRARVESIIQGMSLPPNPLSCDTSRERADTQKGCETPRENKRKPRVPQQQQSDGAAQWAAPGAGSPQAQGCQQLKAQLRFLEQQLRQLQEKFFQVCDPGDAVRAQEGMEKAHLLCGKPGGRSGKDSATAASDPLTVPFWRSVPEMAGHEASEEEEDAGNAGGLPSEARELSEMLKHELAGAASRAVDSVLKTMWLKAAGHLLQWHCSLPVPGEGARREYFASGKCRKPLPKPLTQDVLNSLGGTQAEALSGALEKSSDFHTCPVSSRGARKPCQVPSIGYPLGTMAPVQDNQLLSQLLGYGQHSPWGSTSRGSPSAVDRGPQEPLDLHWGTVKLRSSVMRQQQYPLPLSPADVEGLALLPAARAGCGELQPAMDGAPFTSIHISFGGWEMLAVVKPVITGKKQVSRANAQGHAAFCQPNRPRGDFSLTLRYIQEALTPGHLKKAKLMFFFTRYPSSTLLKTYFLDVQFSRCITSQLIKWFSNFREFYYIQVEKFARQALLEGVADAKVLRVSRDSELFRALNMHYNKGNDFEVPARFLEVASLTLQEFFSAVRAGKDSDPSWKKPIYKIISKLDSDIPEVFKSSGCSQELLRS
ncbi:prospero homeobox protein 2 [Struthio camelus]|uniref:prospero homeobox protein 2 n=1 Tax=Struthio camelus TaxID=8801 RepID=UPI003603F5AD